MGNTRNGLGDRENEKKISKILVSLVGFYLLMCFISPMMISTGEVPELSGRANAIDYAYKTSWGNLGHDENSNIGHDQSKHGGTFSWMELNPLFAFTYAVGDLNCHQKHERSWEINDNQMPVCVRDVGIMLGFIFGALIFRTYGVNRWTLRDTFLTIIPDPYLIPFYEKDSRLMLVIFMILLSITPIGIDGFLQLITNYESNNPLRLITGIFAGFGLGWLVCSMMAARPNKFNSAENVLLPAGSILRIK